MAGRGRVLAGRRGVGGHVIVRALPPYSVRRSARARRARVTISEAGDAVVVLPARAPVRAAAELVAHHARWIERHVERIADRNRALAARPALGGGRSVPIGGVPHAVVLVVTAARGRTRVALDTEARRVTIGMPTADRRPPGLVLESWLRAVARERIAARVAARAAEMGMSVAAVSIRDQRSRWGSASHGGRLSFNWRLVLCPPEVLDYVVVHELAHLAVSGHSPRFWSLVERHFPDRQTARAWLRANHSHVRHALD